MLRIKPDQRQRVTLTVNGRTVSGFAEPRLLLADFLRHELDLYGTHVGCEHGVCGACTVQIDGQPARSCIAYALQADGREVRTVEDLADADGGLSPLQRAFRRHHALQCGFCTPGMLLAARDLLKKNPRPDREQIRAHLSGNYCRCTGYQAIVDAIEEVVHGKG